MSCRPHETGPTCCLEPGHEGPHQYKCASPYCPGLPWAASEHPHPYRCAALAEREVYLKDVNGDPLKLGDVEDFDGYVTPYGLALDWSAPTPDDNYGTREHLDQLRPGMPAPMVAHKAFWEEDEPELPDR